MKGSAIKILWILTLVFVITGCTGAGNQITESTKPVATITSPVSNSSYAVGQEILITFNAADVKGINQIELVVDGEPLMVQPVTPPVNSFSASQRWIIDTPGSHVIELRAFNADGTASDPAQVFITGTGEAVEPTATAAEEEVVADTPTPTVTPAVAPISPPLPTPTPTPEPATSEPVDNQPMVTAVVRLNVRLGPSTDYPVIGRLDLNQSAPITGRDEIAAWWQIEFASDQGDRGWVAAGSNFSTAENADNVPVVEAPPLESVPTSTPAPEPPTATPDASKPTIFSFTANRYTITAGETVELKWDLANAQVALLRYDGLEEGVAAPGSKVFQPQQDTTYTLVARGANGETTAELTIVVVAPGATPVSIFRDGKIRIANGQYIDFDQGLVQAAVEGSTDFQWDGQAKQFSPFNGATGTLLTKSYPDITFQDCQTAAYNQPISGVDGSSSVKGCYLTSEGRYGKFLISEWDLAFNLTIEWQTWNYP